MTQEERDNILLELVSEVRGIKTDVGDLKTDVKGLKTDVKDLQTNVANLQTDVKSLQTNVANLQTDVEKLKTDVESLKTTVDRIDQTVMRIEVEHGEKLQILFDADLYKREKFDSQGHTLERHEKILDKQSDEIYLLKSKVQG